jgi:hypothetical protein
VSKKCFGKKPEILFSCVNLRKKPQKKGKNCQSFETTKIRKNKNKKNIGSEITNQRHISFLSLDNETVETQYHLMVGFKVVSYFKLIILCRIFYLCSKDYQGWFLLNTSFLFEGINVGISRQTEEK